MSRSPPARPGPGQALLAAEAVVGRLGVDELLGAGRVELEALRLDVGPEGAADVRALVPIEPQPLEGIVQVLDVFIGVARPIGVLEPQDEGAAVRPREEVVNQGRPNAAYMLKARRRGRIAYSDLHSGSISAAVAKGQGKPLDRMETDCATTSAPAPMAMATA